MSNKTIEKQLEEIFGDNFVLKADINDQLDEVLLTDLESAVGFDTEPFVKKIAGLFRVAKLTHSQQALIFTELLASSSLHCEVANVINIKTLETNLGAALGYTAKKAEGPVEPLILASLDRVAAAAFSV